MQITDLVKLDTNGYFFADYPSFLSWVQEQYRTIYGADVYLEADSQDGQWLAILAKAFYDTASVGSSVYNSFSPATAQGVGLSRNVKINGISRRIATFSTVDVTVVGQAGTLITDGIAIDELEQKWNLPASVLIPGGGSITVTATAQDIGAIQASADTVNRIFTPTLGWQTVNNSSDASPGEPIETDAELRLRQTQSTANPSQTVFEGTIGAVANVTGVTKVQGYENPTGATVGGLPPHSISIVAAGGTAQDVAQAIQIKKTPGTQTNGTTTEIVYDSRGMPLSIKFYRPDVIPIKARVTVSIRQGWSADFIARIKEAVADVINAGGIGDDILITKLYAPAYLTGTPASSTFDITALEIAKVVDAYGTINIPLDFDEMPTCDPLTQVTVVVV